MKNLHKYIWLLIIPACLTPFQPQTAGYEALLVVDALVTDAEGLQKVALSYSYEFEEAEPVYVTSANVEVMSEDGEVFEFVHKENGEYFPSNSFVGEVGKRYKLNIRLDGDIYESDYELLKASPPIGDLYARFETRNTSEGVEKGFQIYVDSEDPTGETGYYRWDFDEAWIMRSRYLTFYEWEGRQPVPLDRLLYTCYVSDISKNILIQSTRGLVDDQVSEQEVLFVSTVERGKLNARYGMEIRQYALNEKSFNFWKDLKEITEASGTLFDKQPFQLLSNIKNTSNPNEPVLGYFEVSGSDSKKIFLSTRDIDREEQFETFDPLRRCAGLLDTVFFQDLDRAISIGNGVSSMFVDTLYNENGPPAALGWRFAPNYCVDCRLSGGKLDPPLFWEE